MDLSFSTPEMAVPSSWQSREASKMATSLLPADYRLFASTMHTVPLLYANNKRKGMAQFHSPREIPLSLGAGRKLLLD